MHMASELLPLGDVWYSWGHFKQDLMSPGSALGLYVPSGQAA